MCQHGGALRWAPVITNISPIGEGIPFSLLSVTGASCTASLFKAGILNSVCLHSPSCTWQTAVLQAHSKVNNVLLSSHPQLMTSTGQANKIYSLPSSSTSSSSSKRRQRGPFFSLLLDAQPMWLHTEKVFQRPAINPQFCHSLPWEVIQSCVPITLP